MCNCRPRSGHPALKGSSTHGSHCRNVAGAGWHYPYGVTNNPQSITQSGCINPLTLTPDMRTSGYTLGGACSTLMTPKQGFTRPLSTTKQLKLLQHTLYPVWGWLGQKMVLSGDGLPGCQCSPSPSDHRVPVPAASW